jgi:hypothetical protein
MAANGCSHLVRSLAHLLGRPIGGVEHISEVEMPFLQDVPHGWAKAAFVRHPLDRLLASWQQNILGRKSLAEILAKIQGLRAEMNFNEFVRRI